MCGRGSDLDGTHSAQPRSDTKERNYYIRTIHGSLRQEQRLLNRKAGQSGANRQTYAGKIRLDQYLDNWLEGEGQRAARQKDKNGTA